VKHIEIYADGACRGNPGPGGWAALLIAGDQRKEISGSEKLTTNNRMELLAAISGIEALKKPGTTARVYTDSQYVIKGISEWVASWKQRGWKTADKKPVKNQDLWERLDAIAEQHEIEWHWVRGHSGVPGNERVDQLANEAIDAMLSQQCSFRLGRKGPTAEDDVIGEQGRGFFRRRDEPHQEPDAWHLGEGRKLLDADGEEGSAAQ